MKIKEICNYASALLGRSDIATYLETGDLTTNSEVTKEVEVLVRLSNLVISDLSVSYVPFLATEKATTVNGKLEYETLKNKVLEIISVKNELGEEIDFLQYPSHLQTSVVNVEVNYTYLPEEFALEQEFDFPDKRITPSIIAQAVAGEYYLIDGYFEKGKLFYENYKNKINALYLKRGLRLHGGKYL